MDKFEEYKLFVEDTARFTDRRQTVNNIYVAVNSILLGASGLLLGQFFSENNWQGLLAVLIAFAGIVICLQWIQLIGKYKTLVAFRIRHLRKMEEHDGMKDSHKMYHQEDELYPCDEDGNIIKGKGLNISDREKWLPRSFAIIYVVLILAVGLKLCGVFPS